jgi:signal transduction histidine kinase
MAGLIEDALILGKGGYVVETQINKCELVEICNTIIIELKKIDNNEHIIEFNPSPDSIFANTDETLIKQIIHNLLSNALKYSPKGRMVALDVAENNKDIQFRVYDNGIGIPDEDQKLLFEPFHRGSNTGFISGTGLGLAVVKKYVEALKGKIFINSSVNVGTTVTVIITK